MGALGFRFGSAALWLVAAVLLAALIGWELDWGANAQRMPQADTPATPRPVEVTLLPEYRIEGGTASRTETVERPAFVPTRRPAPTPIQEVAKTRMQRGQFLLTGTAVIDKGAVAFLREVAGGKARSVRRGEVINGLTVSEVRPDRVKLALGDESEELVLKVAAGPRTTIQPPQPGLPGTSPVAGAPSGPGAPVPGQCNGAGSGGAPAQGALPGSVPRPPNAGTQGEQGLLERRRAARAAQVAAEVAARANTTPGATGGQPAQAGAAPARTDPAWADVYRRMQQQRR